MGCHNVLFHRMVIIENTHFYMSLMRCAFVHVGLLKIKYWQSYILALFA